MWSSNITVDPLAQASPVEDPELAEVLRLETGEIFKAVEFIAGLRYDALVKLRVDVQEDLQKKRYRFHCAWCSTPAYIVASTQKRFFFRHIEEDGSCAAKTRGLSRDEILARKYLGQREGEPHKRIKGLIERSLAADSVFNSVALEKTWRAARDPKARRQPDVQAVSGERRFAFEVQLSTTFLSVVAGRRGFYREEGGLLIWILGHFTPDYRRMTTDDLLFSNNSNVLVVDDETTALSEASGRFHVRCHHRRSERRDIGDIAEVWDEKVVPFHDLTFDHEGQRAYLHDFEGEETALRAFLKAEEIEAWRQEGAALRGEFFDLWEPPRDAPYEPLKARWQALSDSLEERGMKPLVGYGDRYVLETIIRSMLSAKAGKPVGWRYKTLVELSHHLATNHKNCLLAFGYAVNVYGHEHVIKAEDLTGRWEAKLASIRHAIGSYDDEYLPDDDWVELICFLFPEVYEKLHGYVERRWAHRA